MSKKILFTASTQSHLDNFHQPYIKGLRDKGYQVSTYVPPVSKSMLSLQNLRAIWITRNLLRSEHFDIISSHATLAGIVTRLALILGSIDRRHVTVFHTAHGYLFNDDKSFRKWIYILPEKICATVTDVLMVMNQEDLEIAHKYNLCGKNNNIHYIDGMGIDLNKFKPIRPTDELRHGFGINKTDFVFVYVAEFSKRKNHELLLKGFAQAVKEVSFLPPGATQADLDTGGSQKATMRLALAGDGALLHEMKKLASDLGISDQVIFLGYIKNIQELYACCDVAVTTSRIEGLPFNVMEAMGCGLPVLASSVKGHKELISHNINGLLFESNDPSDLCEKMMMMHQNNQLREVFKASGIEKIKNFSIEKVYPTIMGLYEKNMK